MMRSGLLEKAGKMNKLWPKGKFMSKGKAFVLGMVFIMVIFLVMVTVILIRKEDIRLISHDSYLVAIFGLVTSYLGLNVVDNNVQGKSWSQEKFNSEHNKTEEK